MKGLEILRKGGPALDAVEEGIKVVENDPTVTSVGLGSVPNFEGVVELDASIMDGKTLKAGSVGALRNIRHPISVARKVMELTPHILLVGDGALMFAKSCGFEEEHFWKSGVLDQWKALRTKLEGKGPEALKTDTYLSKTGKVLRQAIEAGLINPLGTVSVVAFDRRGDIAAGNSTSGLAMKVPGRVGDSAIVGAGLYADNRVGGTCTTGVGEVAMTHCLSKRVCDLMSQGLTPQEACKESVAETLERGPAATIAVVALNGRGKPGAAASMKGFTYVYATEDLEAPVMRKAPLVSK